MMHYLRLFFDNPKVKQTCVKQNPPKANNIKYFKSLHGIFLYVCVLYNQSQHNSAAIVKRKEL